MAEEKFLKTLVSFEDVSFIAYEVRRVKRSEIFDSNQPMGKSYQIEVYFDYYPKVEIFKFSTFELREEKFNELKNLLESNRIKIL